VSTSVAAFIGYTQRGPTNEAVQIFSYGDYERQFGGFNKDSPVSYAAHQFFLNGGSEAWVVRVAAGAAAASVSLKSGVGADPVVLIVTAKSQGAWGNFLRLDVDYDTANPASLFNLTVTELQDQNGTLTVARVETHRNLSMSSYSPGFVETVVNAASELVEVSRPASALTGILATKATGDSGVLTLGDLAQLDDDHRRLAITLNGDGPYEFDIFDAGDNLTGATLDDKLDDLAARIKTKVVALKAAFATFACVNVAAEDRLRATAPTPVPNEGEKSSVRFGNASLRSATAILKLGVSNGGRETEGTAAIRPEPSGTVGAGLGALNLTTLPATASLNVTVKAPGLPDDTVIVALWGLPTALAKPVSLEQLRSHVQTALSSSPKAVLSQAFATLMDSQLRIVAGGTNPNARLHFADASPAGLAALLGLSTAVENVSRYALGVGVTSQAQANPVSGSDGGPASPALIKGTRASKTGLYALETVDLFNILCLPDQKELALLSEAIAYAAERRAFVVLDFPAEVDSLAEAKQWLNSNATLRHKNAALYFPRIHMADPLDNGVPRAFPAAGAVAGIYARTDAARGVWKAPAGTEARLGGVQKLDVTLTDPENGALNPLGINCLRNFSVYGPVVWGGRTLDGADALASEWKYVPVRRFALFLEESLYRGTKWVVFEPNDEPLWAQIRLNIGAFMQNLFRQGAFQGQTPREAYFVKCDKETTTQTDINLGIVNILVGFAPLKPAEFVIIKIQQIAGQIPT
jgi:phage tail sheath protein FI